MKHLLLSVLLSLGCAACGGSPQSPLLTQKVVFIGDSVTVAMSGNPEFNLHPNWIGKGVNGQNSAQIAARFEMDVIALHPDIVHILAGTNDVYSWWNSPCSVGPMPWWMTSYTLPELGLDDCATFNYMVQTAKANGALVIIGTIPPWGANPVSDSADPSPERYHRIDGLNAWLKRFAYEQGASVVDYHAVLSKDGRHYTPGYTDDGVHPNAAGQAAMLKALLNIR